MKWIKWNASGRYRDPDPIPEVGKATKLFDSILQFSLGCFETQMNISKHIPSLTSDTYHFLSAYTYFRSFHITEFEQEYWLVGTITDEDGSYTESFARPLTKEETASLNALVQNFEEQKDLIRRKHALFISHELDPDSVSRRRTEVLKAAGFS